MGKSYPSPPPIVMQPTTLPPTPAEGQSETTKEMLNLISEMQADLAASREEVAAASREEATAAVPAPEVRDVPEIQVREPDSIGGMFEEIAAETRAEVEEEAKRRRGLESTVLTSPLLEEEEPRLVTSGIFGA